MRHLSWGLFACLLALTGCVTTNYYSEINPGAAGQKYQRLLIECRSSEPSFAQYGEHSLQKEIQRVFEGSIVTYLYTDQFYTGLSTKEELHQQVRQFMREKGIDGLLVCVNTLSVRKETDIVAAGGTGAPVYTNNDQKDIRYRMELFDTRTGKSVWYSKTTMEGNSFFNSFQGMIDDFVRQTVADMEVRGLLGTDDRPFGDTLGQDEGKSKQSI